MNVNLIWVRSLEWAPNPMTSSILILRRGKFGHRDAQREDSVKSPRKEGLMTEAEIRVM